jgi:hypothetical protein
MSIELNLSATYTPSPACEISHVPDGFVVYQSSSERVHYLNPSAAMIYELCCAGKSIVAIATYLKETFLLPEPPVVEVIDCVKTFLAQGLIKQ